MGYSRSLCITGCSLEDGHSVAGDFDDVVSSIKSAYYTETILENIEREEHSKSLTKKYTQKQHTNMSIVTSEL